MLTLLWALSLFYLFAGAGALAAGMRLVGPEARRAFASRRLHWIAVGFCFSFPVAALAGMSLAWFMFAQPSIQAGIQAGIQGGQHAPLAALAPLAWLVALGALFAVVDVAEDGVMDFGRGPRT